MTMRFDRQPNLIYPVACLSYPSGGQTALVHVQPVPRWHAFPFLCALAQQLAGRLVLHCLNYTLRQG